MDVARPAAENFPDLGASFGPFIRAATATMIDRLVGIIVLSETVTAIAG